jgi:hypothetical protein
MLALFASSESIAFAQVTNPTSPPFGSSTAGGSGGTPTGPTNPGAAGFGTNNVVAPNWPLNPYTSTAAGSGGNATIPHGSRMTRDPRMVELGPSRAEHETGGEAISAETISRPPRHP